MASAKRDKRREIARQVEQFLKCGGEVKQVARGVSGWDPAAGPLRPGRAYTEREPRTPVPEIVAAVELRRQLVRKPQRRRKTKMRRKPVRKLIYDDFGEPLRYEWRDE